ncbi:MAG: hypothetical protein ACRCZF_13410, partial [Gemmataceae bacterium]
FRFSYGNYQMAEAMLDFVWKHPNLQPVPPNSKAVARILPVDWKDDPFSADFLDQFQNVTSTKFAEKSLKNTGRRTIPYSVGGYYLPNKPEAETADDFIREIQQLGPGEKALLVLPTVPAPARRLLRTLVEASPGLGKQIVVLNGDGITVNTIFRDGEFAWPVHALPVPLVLFAHNDPCQWNETLRPPTSTDDVLHYARMTSVLTEAIFRAPQMTPTADALQSNLHDASPLFFDRHGQRLDRSDQCVILLKPGPVTARGLPDATLEVYKRDPAGRWNLTRMVPIHQSRSTNQTAGGQP